MNTAIVSIIVPTLNEAERIESVLMPLQHLRGKSIEIIVVDGGSDDDTMALSKPLVDCATTSTKGRASQMNYGAKLARGRWLLFLHADTALPLQFADVVALWQEVDAAWGFFRVKLDGDRLAFRIIESCMNLRSRLTRIGTGDQSLFVSKRLFDGIGGFSDIPLMEDVSLCKTLRRYCAPLIVKQPVFTSSRRWRQNGIVTTILLMWRLRLLYFIGVKPQELVKQYYRST